MVTSDVRYACDKEHNSFLLQQGKKHIDCIEMNRYKLRDIETIFQEIQLYFLYPLKQKGGAYGTSFSLPLRALSRNGILPFSPVL